MTSLQLGSDAWVRWADPAALAGREDEALTLLSSEERARLDATIPSLARERLLWGRMLLRELVGGLAAVSPPAVEIAARCIDCGGPHGRPVVVGGTDHVRALTLSVSACAGMLVVGAADRISIGVDVEPRAGTDERVRAIRQLTGHEEDPLRHWTQVEAVLKADGRGLRVDPANVQVDGRRAELDGTLYRLVDIPVNGDFVVSVALGQSIRPGGEAEPR
ncbi:4'-phosphopantetheinyl transferase family protein [Mycetocola sp.]|uniref:4'-phosphopantetheinyl transferase family protein n=1 Tax=Mycetocola sp. TaxID=1871042 RepID=UPI003989BD12